MKSTRSNLVVSPFAAILQGLAPDGGLFVLDKVPANLFQDTPFDEDYVAYATSIFHALMEDYPLADLRLMLSEAYGSSLFPNGVVPIHATDSEAYLELYHGPTFAFKDLALSVLPRLFDYAKQRESIALPTVILTATSGDTGGAALSGFSSLNNTYVIVLYPKHGVSPLQEQQMNSFQGENCLVLGVNGNFDDCQRIAKDVFGSYHPDHVILSSANSINIGRIIPQIVYYMYGYHQLVNDQYIQAGDPINITVPTGNFGNIYAAFLAKQLGLPVNKLIIASNENDVLTDLFHTGEYRINRTLHTTISPSMDIVVSSNLERYLYHLANEDHTQVQAWMTSLQDRKTVSLPHIDPDNLFYAGKATQQETLNTIRTVWENEQYLMDPHTAVAHHVTECYRTNQKDDTYTMIAATASPYKFAGAISTALGIKPANSLLDTIQSIEIHTGIPADSRLKLLLHQSHHHITVELQDAKHRIMEWIGDL